MLGRIIEKLFFKKMEREVDNYRSVTPSKRKIAQGSTKYPYPHRQNNDDDGGSSSSDF